MSERQAARDPYDEVIGSIAAMSPSKQFGTATVRVYAAALRDVPLDELREVVWEIIKTRIHPPTVSEILSAVAKRRLGLPEPMAAWETLMAALEAHTYSELPEAVRRAADAVGGPYTIRQTDNEIALRAHFLTAYKEFSATAEHQVVLSIGAHETQKEVTRG